MAYTILGSASSINAALAAKAFDRGSTEQAAPRYLNHLLVQRCRGWANGVAGEVGVQQVCSVDE